MHLVQLLEYHTLLSLSFEARLFTELVGAPSHFVTKYMSSSKDTLSLEKETS